MTRKHLIEDDKCLNCGRYVMPMDICPCSCGCSSCKEIMKKETGDFKKLERAIEEIEFYLDFYPVPRIGKEQRHLCFALECLKQLQAKAERN